MTLPSADESLLRRYLLGTITPPSREELETRLFSDDRTFWERLSIAEDELVSDYVQNALNGEERQDFEKHFLATDERRAKLEFARALHSYSERSGAAREPRWSWLRRPVLSPAWALAAAALLLVIVQLPRLASRGSADGVEGTVVAIALPTGRTRAVGAELTRVRIQTNTQIVKLQLEPGPTQYASYRASLYNVDDDALLAEMRLLPSSNAGDPGVSLTLPSELLAEGDYYVRLHGISPAGEPVPLQRYDFRVLHD
jgi:hypothetical protein